MLAVRLVAGLAAVSSHCPVHWPAGTRRSQLTELHHTDTPPLVTRPQLDSADGIANAKHTKIITSILLSTPGTIQSVS